MNTYLIIPLLTTHIGGYGWNNDNPGIGLELADYDQSASIVYLDKNSNGDSSVYLGLARKFHVKQVTFSAGVTLATGYHYKRFNGYDQETNSYRVAPILGVEYKSIRLVTTYPFDKMSCEQRQICGDFINLQYTYRF